MRQINIEGTILCKKPYGEGHELVFIFSKELGKIKTVAKGSRKIKSKFLGHLETLNICNFQLYQSSHSLLITECNTIQPFKFDKLSHLHTNYALKIANFLMRTLAEEQADIVLYKKVKSAINNFTQSDKPLIEYLQLCIYIIDQLGFYSDFTNTCPTCHSNISAESPFYLMKGDIIICEKCTNRGPIDATIPGKYRKFLNHLNEISTQNKDRLKINEEERFYLEKLIEAFFGHYSSSFN